MCFLHIQCQQAPRPMNGLSTGPFGLACTLGTILPFSEKFSDPNPLFFIIARRLCSVAALSHSFSIIRIAYLTNSKVLISSSSSRYWHPSPTQPSPLLMIPAVGRHSNGDVSGCLSWQIAERRLGAQLLGPRGLRRGRLLDERGRLQATAPATAVLDTIHLPASANRHYWCVH